MWTVAESIVKLNDAFEERGRGDFLASTDFEDVICLFNGRASIVAEIAADAQLAPVLGRKFSAYLAAPELEDAVDGFIQTEPNSAARKATVMARFRDIAALAPDVGRKAGEAANLPFA